MPDWFFTETEDCIVKLTATRHDDGLFGPRIEIVRSEVILLSQDIRIPSSEDILKREGLYHSD